MIFKWETEDERLARFKKIPPIKKMEWLYEMHRFLIKTSSSKRILKIRQKLREMENKKI